MNGTTIMKTRDQLTREDHTCSCEHCDPSLVVMSRRQGAQHIGVRFWDDPVERAQTSNVEILLDDTVVHGVFEAILGETGTIWRYRGVPSAANEGRHVCLTCRDRLAASGVDTEDAPISPCREKVVGNVGMRAVSRQPR